MASKYRPIWDRIKKNGKATVSAHPLLFRRICKAVIKQKDLDLAFKVANDFDNFKLQIHRDADKHQITFVLKQKIGIEDMKNV